MASSIAVKVGNVITFYISSLPCKNRFILNSLSNFGGIFEPGLRLTMDELSTQTELIVDRIKEVLPKDSVVMMSSKAPVKDTGGKVTLYTGAFASQVKKMYSGVTVKKSVGAHNKEPFHYTFLDLKKMKRSERGVQ